MVLNLDTAGEQGSHQVNIREINSRGIESDGVRVLNVAGVAPASQLAEFSLSQSVVRIAAHPSQIDRRMNRYHQVHIAIGDSDFTNQASAEASAGNDGEWSAHRSNVARDLMSQQVGADTERRSGSIVNVELVAVKGQDALSNDKRGMCGITRERGGAYKSVRLPSWKGHQSAIRAILPGIKYDCG